MHSPIRQDLVLLRRGKDNAAARAFVEFLTSPAAQATIRASGYDTPTP
jgi:molybdate transport system substrate-binding protein